MSGRATSTPDGFVRDGGAGGDRNQLWFLFDRHRLVLDGDGRLPVVGDGDGEPELEDIAALGHFEGQTVFSAGVVGDLPDGWTSVAMRSAFGRLSEAQMGLAGYAAQVIDFARTHRFCGRCGAALGEAVLGETVQGRNTHECSRTCPACGLTVYPRVAPVVMVLIGRGEGAGRELLLARGPQFPPGMYSALAGFVEPSETLEMACHREVLEEVGVRIENLRYDHSQPWPFPHSLMMGFTAEYVGGEIVPQPGEIEDAAWFPVTALPPLPPTFSIARRLIDEAVTQALGDGRDA